MCVGALCSDCIVWRLHCAAAALRGSVVGMTDRQVDSARPAGTQSWQVAGVGHDVVDVPAFAEQLAMPGTRFAARAFAPVELRQCQERAARAGDGTAVHLAARWAGKEAVLKAWSEALGPGEAPYTIDDFPWRDVRIVEDPRHRPRVMLTPAVEARLPFPIRWHVSLSHDGAVASAFVVAERLA